MLLLILILIILLFLILNYYFDYDAIENYDKNNIIFLDKNEVIKLLINDEDNYYSRFFYNDLKVRNIKNIDQYKEIIKKSAIDINDDEKNKLRKIINEIDDEFKDINLNYFNGQKLNNLKWKIGVLKNNDYEAGLPSY